MSTDDRDRTVHAISPAGAEIVRYDRAGKWFMEGSAHRQPMSLADAVDTALLPGATVFLGRLGGKLFDARVKKAQHAPPRSSPSGKMSA